MTKRKPIGRTLTTSSLLEKDTQNLNSREQTFILSSGQKATFFFRQIAADDLAKQTYVDIATNGRDQSALTEIAVSDISRTLTLQQFFPAIGCKRTDGRIEILDGSRRRAAALFVNTGLDVLVTETDIGFEDARALARDIQTAREHNLREVGMRLLTLRESGMNQKEIAKSQGLSEAKVTRAIQAASVPVAMLTVFPVQAELTHPDYKFLYDLASRFSEQSLDLNTLVSAVALEEDKLDTSLALDNYKDAIIRLYKDAANLQLVLSESKKAKHKVEKLWQFKDKDTFARRKEKERSVSYEFNRLPKAVMQALDEAVLAVLKKHLG